MELSDLHKNDLKIELMVIDFRKVRICRITFGRPKSTTQNYLRAGAAPDLLLFKPHWRRIAHGATMWRFCVEWWSQNRNPLSSDVGLVIFIFGVTKHFFIKSWSWDNNFLFWWEKRVCKVSGSSEEFLKRYTFFITHHVCCPSRVGPSNDVRSSWN